MAKAPDGAYVLAVHACGWGVGGGLCCVVQEHRPLASSMAGNVGVGIRASSPVPEAVVEPQIGMQASMLATLLASDV